MFWLINFADLCDFRILTQIMFVCLMALNTIKQANIICVPPKNPKHNCNEVQGLYFRKWGLKPQSSLLIIHDNSS